VAGIGRISCAISLDAESPVRIVNDFCDEIKAAVRTHGARARLKIHRMLGYVWADVGFALMRKDPARCRKAAGVSACKAILCDPGQFRRQAVRGFLALSRRKTFRSLVNTII
jgi:hypothetical protein